MASGIYWITVGVLLLFQKVSEVECGVCNFPSFLWSPLPDGSKKYWMGKKEFLAESSIWQFKEEILIRSTEISIKVVSRSRCTRTERQRRDVHCFNPSSSFTMNCLAEERYSKYRVYTNHSGKTTFSCIKFVKRNDNVVQIYKAADSEENEDILCHDNYLQRQDWPWILPDLNAWIFCPNFGGFDFRATDSVGNAVCSEMWQPSRVESECVIGEGLLFYFPKPVCAPFQKLEHEYRMQCWGHWTEENYQYILFGETGQLPRYSLRFAKNAKKYDELSADLYLNAVVPDNSSAYTNSSHWKLELLRSDQGVCYDESERCREAARNGDCSPPAEFKHANLCRYSCGLCDLAPSAKSECNFHAHLRGDWLLFLERGQQVISVMDGQVMFSEFGQYSCKSVLHWERGLYKVMSVYTNGCRPRYTCLKMQKESGDTATVQFSRSSLEDRSFEMCHFEDDIAPLGSFIHSETPKHLLPLSSMVFTTCNLNGLAVVRTSFMDGQQCEGSISDISEFTCQPTGSFIVQSEKTCTHPEHHEYDCVASASLSKGQKFLVTEYDGTGVDIYVCWVSGHVPSLTWGRGQVFINNFTGAYGPNNLKTQLIDWTVNVQPVFTRVTCDTAVSYENFTGSNSVYYVKEGISTIALTTETERPCHNIQDDAEYVPKHLSPSDKYLTGTAEATQGHFAVSGIAINPPPGNTHWKDDLGSPHVTPPFWRSDTRNNGKDKSPTSYIETQGARESANNSDKRVANSFLNLILVCFLTYSVCGL